MKEKITEEYEKFENIMKGTDNQLCALILTDIMASLTTVYKDDKGHFFYQIFLGRDAKGKKHFN